MSLRRYWIEFDLTNYPRRPLGGSRGCEMTTHSRADALDLIRKQVFNGQLPTVSHLVEDVDVSQLDAGHVRPNMGNPAVSGIWFPLGYK